MITTKIRVELLDIWLLKLSAIKIIPSQLTILPWESWDMSLCWEEDLITAETVNRFESISWQNKWKSRSMNFHTGGLPKQLTLLIRYLLFNEVTDPKPIKKIRLEWDRGLKIPPLASWCRLEEHQGKVHKISLHPSQHWIELWGLQRTDFWRYHRRECRVN